MYFDSVDGVEGEFGVGDRYLKIELGVISDTRVNGVNLLVPGCI
jgi:hypothetical protein